jgi:rare lipoprotein A
MIASQLGWYACRAMSTPTQRRSSGPLPPWVALAPAALVLTLAACATRTPAPPPDVMSVPDAVPVLEAIRQGGPNKPYAVLGETYTPLPAEAALSETGLASWYGQQFHGRRTASGEIYDMHAMTAAHRTLPLPSFARVSNPANGRSVIVRVNDRGPFTKGRIIDLSYAAARKLGVVDVATVKLVRITPEEIRRGQWQANPGAVPDAAAAPAPDLAQGRCRDCLKPAGV